MNRCIPFAQVPYTRVTRPSLSGNMRLCKDWITECVINDCIVIYIINNYLFNRAYAGACFLQIIIGDYGYLVNIQLVFAILSA